MKTLTPAQAIQIQDTLAHARAGNATLAQLAVAHDLAEGASLNNTLGELRTHIRNMTPGPSPPSRAKNVLWGIMGGMIAASFVDFYVYRTLNHLHTRPTERP